MARTAYHKELEIILKNDDPAKPTSASRAEIEATIEKVSRNLKGPCSDVDRLDLVEYRRELRKQLEALNT